jgi:uncharacterized protein (DUF849 family)
MPRKVIITCAVTGGGAISKNSKYVPITPQQIADDAIAAAKAGASVVHIHVRDPQTGAPSMKFELYKEVADRIRSSGADAILNLTTGVGARFVPPIDNPAAGAANMKTAVERVEHVVKLKPEICTLDIATMNFGPYSIVNSHDYIKAMAKMINEVGVKPELEVFDIGQLRLALELVKSGDLPPNPLFQFCLGILGGAPATPEVMMLMKSMIAPGTLWAGFGISRMQMPMLAQVLVLGGNVRVGLEDNLFLGDGELSRGNAPLVERAVKIIEGLGETVATPSEARAILGLKPV